jgi:PAS domain S-box-containing protein
MAPLRSLLSGLRVRLMLLAALAAVPALAVVLLNAASRNTGSAPGLNILTITAVAAIALAAAWLGGEALILRPVRAMLRAAERLAQGDLSARTGLVAGPGELNQLARVFDRMAEARQRHEAERDRAQAAQLTSEERYRALIANFPNGAVIMFDHDLRHTLAAGGGLADVGLSSELLEGKTIWEVFPPETCALLEPHYRAALAGVSESFEVPYAGRVYLLHALPIRNDRGDVTAGMTMTQNITERKQMEADLMAEAAIRRAIESAIPSGIAVVDLDGRQTYVNPAFSAMVGWNEAELVGATAPHVYWPAEEIDRIQQALQVTFQGQAPPAGFELRFCRRSGERFDALVVVRALKDSHGQQTGWLASVSDITERKRAEEALQASEARNRALVNAIPDMMFRIHRDGTYLDFRAERLSDLAMPAETIIGRNVRDLPAGPELLELTDNIFKSALETGQVQTIEYTLPAASGERHYEARHMASGPDEIVAIVRDITDRKQAEAALARWAHVFEHAEWGIAVGSSNGQTLELVNPAFARMHGYTVEELTGQPIATVFAPGSEHALGALIETANDNGHGFAESMHARKDGSIFPVWIDLTAVRDESGQLLYRVANVQDITERKRAEAVLQQSQQRYEALVNTIDGIVWEADALTFEYSFVSQQAERLLGYPAERWVNEPTFWPEHIHPDDRDWAVNFCALATSELRAHEFEYRMLAADGRVVWLRDVVTVLVEDNRPKILRGVMIDITERKLAEARLREKEEQYRSIFETVSDGLFITDLDTSELIDFNPAAAHMHGYTVEEFRQLRPPDFVHPDSYRLFEEYLTTVRAGGVYRARATDVRRDGSLLPIEVLGTSVTYGGQRRCLGVVRDIAEQVHAYQLLEQRVEERTRELSALLEISHSVASTLELGPRLGLILDQLVELVDYHTAVIYSLDDGRLNGLDWRAPRPLQLASAFRLVPGTGLELLEALQNGEPVAIGDVEHHAAAERAVHQLLGQQPGRHVQPLRSWLAVPLRAKDRTIGILSLHHTDADYYTPRHASMALAIANQAAVALENARLYQQAQSLAALEERQKLARELHDSVSQALYGIALGTRTARTQLERDPARAAEPLDYVLSLAEAGLTEMRALIFELRPESLHLEGLVAALTKQAASLQARHHIQVQTDLGTEPPIILEAKETLYRIAQEALHNIVKHARANKVTVQLAVDSDGATLDLHDDGIGFEPGGSFPGHLGLQSMRERAARLGGSMHIDSAPGCGTRISVTLPAGCLIEEVER